MSIEQTNSVDAIGIDNDNGFIVLTISDHLEWNEEHHYLLQEKINSYLSFIESGELVVNYPSAEGKKVLIKIVCMFEPSESSLVFLGKINNALKQDGLMFCLEVLTP